MSEHQVRGCIFTQYTHCKQNELGHTISWTKVLNVSSMSICAMIGNGSWRETEESSALFFLITLSLPSFSFTYWSGHSDKHSNLGSSRCGLPRSCPAFCWPCCFHGLSTPHQQKTAGVSAASSSADCCIEMAQHGAKPCPEVPRGRGWGRAATTCLDKMVVRLVPQSWLSRLLQRDVSSHHYVLFL